MSCHSKDLDEAEKMYTTYMTDKTDITDMKDITDMTDMTNITDMTDIPEMKDITDITDMADNTHLLDMIDMSMTYLITLNEVTKAVDGMSFCCSLYISSPQMSIMLAK